MANTESTNVRELFNGVAPERVADINEIFDTRCISYDRASDRPGLYMRAMGGLVLYSDRAIQLFYLGSFLAWKALVEQSGAVVGMYMLNDRTYDYQQLLKEPSRGRFENEVDKLAAALGDLAATDELSLSAWPTQIPRPTPQAPSNIEDRAAHELTLFSLAYALLHETRHALYADGEGAGGIQEEFHCDKYALDFLTRDIDRYAQISKQPAEKIRTKRAMGVMLGQAVILELTPPELWAAGSHPPMRERWSATMSGLNLDPWDDAYVYASSILLSKLRRLRRDIGRIPFESPRDLCEKLVAAMV